MSSSTAVRPEPVLDAGKIAGAATGVLTALATLVVSLGIANQTDADSTLVATTAVIGAVVSLVNVVVPIWKAKQARSLVTPLSDPQNNAGLSLVPGVASDPL